MDNRAFPHSKLSELPDEVSGIILNQVDENIETLFSCMKVNKQWASFFRPKFDSLHFLENLKKLHPYCSIISTLEVHPNLADIKSDVEWALRFINLEQKKSLFLALKLMEWEVMQIYDSHNKPAFYDILSVIKIYFEEFKQYLIDKFGIAGMVGPSTVKRIFFPGDFRENLMALNELLALQTILQVDTPENTITLDWIRSFFSSKDWLSLIHPKIFLWGNYLNIEFKENQLYLVGKQNSKTNVCSIDTWIETYIQVNRPSVEDINAGKEEYKRILTLLGYSVSEEQAHIWSFSKV